MTSITDTLSGYSPEALRAMRDQAQSERKDAEARRYGDELKRRIGDLCNVVSSPDALFGYVYGDGPEEPSED